MTDLDLLRVHLSSRFLFDETGRIVCENDPDRSRGPSAVFAGCADGNLVFFGKDVIETAEVREMFVAEEAPDGKTGLPRNLNRYVDLLDLHDVTIQAGPIYVLPHDTGFASDAPIITSHSDAGQRLLDEFDRNGMPESLSALGFTDIGELWPPWCAALVGDDIAALAFAARLDERGADIGVITVPGFRSRGLAAAVTAAWTHLPTLASRALFYSTSQSNRSSQRVAARLGLRLLGVSCVLTRKY